MKRLFQCFTILILIMLLGGCSKVHYSFNDAVKFRLENDSGLKMYGASVSFGTGETVFGSMAGENANGTALQDKGNECMVFPVEEADLNGTGLQDMVFDFYVCTQKDRDYRYVGRALVISSELHQTYTMTVIEQNGKLILSSREPNIEVIPAAGK